MLTDLDKAQKDAANAGELDEAVLIRDARKGIADAGPNAPKRRWIPGTWAIRYQDKTVHTFVVHPDGRIEWTEGKRGQLRTSGDSAVFQAGPRVERWTFVGNRMFAEHFLSVADYERNVVNALGCGEMVK